MKPKEEPGAKEIGELPPIIEKLCDELRALRRENPECFFAGSEHRLYCSLEAALESYYRSKVQEKDASL